MRAPGWIAILTVAAFLSGCATRAPVSTSGKGATTILDVREGIATYYGPGFHGKTTASGVRFDMNAMVAAHPSYPFGTLVRVTNLRNGRSVNVRILDRGPAARIQADGVIIDLSRGAAERLGFISEGRTHVRVEVLELGEP
jgi:rare lipoprotein A